MDPASPETLEAAAQLHRRIDPLHSLIYFAPEIGDRLGRLGLEAFFSRYFAQRAAAMGAVGPGVVTATFGVFNPELVARYLEGVWATASPADVLAARLRAVDDAYRRLLGDAVDGPAVREAAALARRACSAATPEDRPLYAAHADLPWPDETDEPHLVLWHAATLLREYRGDVHLHALTAAGLTALESLITHTATGRGFLVEVAQRGRGWSAGQWAEAAGRLRERGILAADGTLTDHGVALRQDVEDHTTRLSSTPTAHLGADDAARLTALAAELGEVLRDAGAFPEGVFAPGSDRAPAPGQGGRALTPGE